MAKFDFSVAVAFATQTAEGTYNSTLDGITTTLLAADGLLLGDPESGVRQSGLALTLGRRKRDKAFIGSTFTRSLSDFLAAEVRTFTFAFPFCGNRGTASSPPVDGDAVPLTGIDALLEGAGMTGSAWGSGVGHSYVYGSPNPISALVYYFGNRLELLDCRCSLAIEFTPTSIPIATATIEVGSVKNHAVAAIPSTLTYGDQQTVSAPVIQAVGNAWQDTRGFSTLTLNIAPSFEDIPDSNAATGLVKEQTDRETRIEATLFADDSVDEGYEYSQLIEASQGNLDPLAFTVGDAMTNGSVVEAVTVSVPEPEADEASIAALGTKAANDLTLFGRGTAGNDELELIFV